MRIAPHCEHGDGPLPHPISFQAIMLEYSLDSSDNTDTNLTHTPSEACISCAPLATPQLLHYLQWELIYFCILISLALLFLKKSHKPFYHSHLFVFDMSYSDLLKSTPFISAFCLLNKPFLLYLPGFSSLKSILSSLSFSKF